MAGSSAGYSDEDDASLMTDINITPLVDVVLVLLIVFLITVPSIVASSALKVNLPESSAGSAASTAQPWELGLQSDASGQARLYLGREPTNREALEKLLDESGAARSQQEVRLSADRSLEYGEVVKVLDMLAEMKLEKVQLRTQRATR